MKLRGKQKRYLRSQAHHLQPIFQVGKGGLNDAMITQIDEALEKRELIKNTLLQNTDEVAEEVAEELTAAIHCDVVQIIGRVLVLFKPSSKEKYQKISAAVKEISYWRDEQWEKKDKRVKERTFSCKRNRYVFKQESKSAC